MTGSSLYSRAETTHISKPSRFIISGSTVSSRCCSHPSVTLACWRKGRIFALTSGAWPW